MTSKLKEIATLIHLGMKVLKFTFEKTSAKTYIKSNPLFKTEVNYKWKGDSIITRIQLSATKTYYLLDSRKIWSAKMKQKS